MDRYNALQMIRDWSEKERKKRKKVSAMGVLSAKEQRALKLKQAEKAGIAEMPNPKPIHVQRVRVTTPGQDGKTSHEPEYGFIRNDNLHPEAHAERE
jgi:hypothetical protein